MIGNLAKQIKAVMALKPTPPPSHQPSRSVLLQLSLLIGIAVILHFGISSMIIGIFASIIFALKVGLIYWQKSAPPKFIMMMLTLSSVIMILFLYGGWNGQRAGISFLVLLVCLKFLESRTLRDYFVVCLILYFLAASSFLFEASISRIALVLMYTFAITILLIKLSSPANISYRTSLGTAATIVLKALPLAIFLFFFFPRIQGSFGFLPSQDQKAENELSDALQAGDFAASAFNNSLAFRVEFEGQIPNKSQLYWRSKTMPIENNFRWQVKPINQTQLSNRQSQQRFNSSNEEKIVYTILHEKSRAQYLPYLDYVTDYSIGKQLPDYSVWQPEAQQGAFSYQGSSILRAYKNDIDTTDNGLLLQTQSQPSARLQLLLKQWRQQTNDPSELVNLIYQYFLNNNFKYSLEPPKLNNNPIDDFLFNTQTGYCEHYASSFSILARWLGIPARVVVGFHGGELNQSGEFMEIRYSDAHAWSEVWINQQWVRVDPTAAISPERIEYGMSAFMSLWNGSGIIELGDGKRLANYLNPTGISHYYRLFKDTLSNISYQWNKWIVDYNFEKQKQLLSKLGLESRNSLYTLIIILIVGSLLIVLFYFWNQLPKPIKREEVQILYLRFVAGFKRFGVSKDIADTPDQFAQKAKHEFPHLHSEIDAITNAYKQIRYSQNDIEIKSFKHLIKQFKLEKAQ